MKRIQCSVKVKIIEYVHAWFEFLFVSLLLIFNFFSQINHFYNLTSLRGLQDVENHCAHLRDIELKTGRKIPYLHILPHVYYSLSRDHQGDLLSLYNWIVKHENTKLKKIFASNIRKRTQKQAQKDMNEME